MSVFCGKHGIVMSTRCAQCDAEESNAVIEKLKQRIAAAERQCEWALSLHAYPPTRLAVQIILDALRIDRSEKELQRASDLLSEVAGCGISRTAEGRYHEVQIPLDLWDAIRAEQARQTSD